VAATVALATCGTRDAIPDLLAALEDPEPLVAQGAAMALENLTGQQLDFNAFTSAEKRKLDAAGWRQRMAQTPWSKIEQDLLTQLGSGDRDKARRAAVALGHIGSSAVASALRAYVKTESTVNPYPSWKKSHRGDNTRFNAQEAVNPRSLQAATRALGLLKDEKAINMLSEIIAKNNDAASGNLFLVEAAVEALGRIGGPQAESALLTAFSRFKPYQTYCEWYGDHGALIACHASPPHYFVIEALDAMGSTRADAIIPQLIRSVPTDPARALLLANDDYESLVGRIVRRNRGEGLVVETCLSILGDASATRDNSIANAIGTVHGAWAGKPGPKIRAAQILSLVCRNSDYEPKVRAALERYRLTTTDIQRQFNTGIPIVNKLPTKHWTCFFLARTLGNLMDPAAVPTLLAGLGQDAEAAYGYPDPLGPAVHFLHNDLTPCWRAACAWALGEIGDPQAVPALLAVVNDLKNATDTRHAAIEALAKLAQPKHLEAIRKTAEKYPEISTGNSLLTLSKQLEDKKP
jgi:HEAT repeat protein